MTNIKGWTDKEITAGCKVLPSRRYHKTPRPLQSDAYTINGYLLESKEATDNSVYYGTFRKFPHKHEPVIYDPADSRILVAGLQSICDTLFYDPITHKEIDETVEFLKGRKATATGFRDFEFPEDLWRKVVNDHGGYLPLKVEGIPEGGVVYPGEPWIRVRATAPGFGPLVPWFESTLLHAWAPSERLTAARHALRWAYNLVRAYEPSNIPNEECMFLARLMIHDFGDRAATCPQESEMVAKVHNYVFYGTDTFRGAYQSWKNGAPAGSASSVKALAHRIVQGFDKEFDCYEQMFNQSEPGEFLSMVGDCYDYWNAVENKLIPLAKKSLEMGGGRVVVARPDSGDSVEMVVGTLQRALVAGLMEPHETTLGPRWKSTTLRFIVGNGETFETIRSVVHGCMDAGFVPWRCGIFGVGGHLRNNINRDHMSTKFAMCSVGSDARPVIKLSEEPGKRTLPETKVLRSPRALETGQTLCLPREFVNVPDALVTYYDGSKTEPFVTGFTDEFSVIENRVISGFDKMPLSGGDHTCALDDTVNELVSKYRK